MSVLKTDGVDIAKLKQQYQIIEDKWLDSSVGVVAVYDELPRPHFVARIGATEGISHKEEMYLIAYKGNKLDERVARAIFPYIKHPYKESRSMDKINFAQMHWNVIAHCEREDAFGHKIAAEWFIKDGTFATREDAEKHQAAIEKNTKGTDAEWPEANATAKIVHDDELVEYGLTPLNAPQASLEDIDVDDETAAIERLGDQAYYII